MITVNSHMIIVYKYIVERYILLPHIFTRNFPSVHLADYNTRNTQKITS